MVIGASRRRGTVGRAILDNIRTGGYAGRLYVVNLRARQIGGEHCLSSALDLPESIETLNLGASLRAGTSALISASRPLLLPSTPTSTLSNISIPSYASTRRGQCRTRST